MQKKSEQKESDSILLNKLKKIVSSKSKKYRTTRRKLLSRSKQDLFPTLQDLCKKQSF